MSRLFGGKKKKQTTNQEAPPKHTRMLSLTHSPVVSFLLGLSQRTLS